MNVTLLRYIPYFLLTKNNMGRLLNLILFFYNPGQSVLLFFEHEIDCQYDENKGDQMIYPEVFGFKDQKCKESKDQDRNDFLDNLQFNK